MTTWRCRATVIVAGLVVLALPSCAEDRNEALPAPPPSAASSTTAPPTTTPETTGATSSSSSVAATPSSSSTSVAPGEFPYWSAACVERLGTAGRAYEFDERLGEFTTLGARATLDLQAPSLVTSVGPYGAIAGKSVIPGGVLVGVYPPNGWPSADELLTSSSLVAVDHDGTLRWRRCFDDVETTTFVVAPAPLEPTTAWVVTSAWDDPLQILGVDLATGADVPFPSDAWPVGAFDEECCGGYDYVNVGQVGAIVIATNEQQIRIWYPPQLTFPTRSVDLMS